MCLPVSTEEAGRLLRPVVDGSLAPVACIFEPAMTLPAGTRLGAYEILASLGAGGMGEVYRAKDARLSREVAAKVRPAELAGDTERLARFEQEARSASALRIDCSVSRKTGDISLVEGF